MSKSSAQPPDFQAAADKDTRANRPNQNTPWASSTWTQGPDGSYTQNVGLSGPLAGAGAALGQQAADALGTPMDWGQFGELQDGSAAREQAITSTYDEATRRLDPMWRQRDEATRTALANQGLDPNSEAARGATAQMGQERSDAYGSAMAGAIRAGDEAGNSVFRNNLSARQQAIAEALKERTGALGELQGLQGLLQMPGFATSSGNMQAAQAQWMADNAAAQQNNGRWLDYVQGGASLAQAGAAAAPFLLSDARAKQDIRELGAEALPGVPLVSWEYRAGLGPPGRHVGVLAQDLAAVRPELVRRRADGLLEVNYSFLREVLP